MGKYANQVLKVVVGRNRRSPQIFDAKADDYPLATIHIGARTTNETMERAHLMAASGMMYDVMGRLEKAFASIPQGHEKEPWYTNLAAVTFEAGVVRDLADGRGNLVEDEESDLGGPR